MSAHRLLLSLLVAAFGLTLGANVVGAALSAPTAAACGSNAECACGWDSTSAACAIGHPEQLDAEKPDCYQFCHGFDATLTAVCQLGECVRTRRSPCPGDCDADVAVTVAEIVAGVDIALGERALLVCNAFDASGDGNITIDELLSAVGAALNSCAAAVPLPSGIVGLYDAIMIFDGQPAVSMLGQRSVSGDETTLWFGISPNEGLSLSGTFGADGHADLAGFGSFTDIGYSASGTAQRIDGPAQDRIEGVVHAAGGIFAPFATADFVMQRDAAAPTRFAGTYRLELSRSPGDSARGSSLLMQLDVAPSGVGVLSGGADTAADGTVLGRMTSGRCLIAGGGSLSCTAAYLVAGSQVSPPFRLTGKLDAAASSVSGSGRYLAGVDPPYDIYVFGGWTATRVDPSN